MAYKIIDKPADDVKVGDRILTSSNYIVQVEGVAQGEKGIEFIIRDLVHGRVSVFKQGLHFVDIVKIYHSLMG